MKTIKLYTQVGQSLKFTGESLRDAYESMLNYLYDERLNQFDESICRTLTGSADLYNEYLDNGDWDEYAEIIIDLKDKAFDEEQGIDLIKRTAKEFHLKLSDIQSDGTSLLD